MLNLIQRRSIENFKNSFFTEWESSLKTLYPEIKITVDWDSLYTNTGDSNSDTVAEFWKDLYFNPLTNAIKDIWKDSLGKEALTSWLKNIKISWISDLSNSKNALFKDWEFYINQHSYAYSETPEERSTIWREIMERWL